MKVKFNKFERIGGLFVLATVVGALISGVSVAIKRGWFSPKVTYHTNFENADGVHPGTYVQIAGLRAGAVEDVELQADNRIKVKFTILKKFGDRVRSDSTVQLIRPFIIGDRVLDISVGNTENPIVENQGELQSQEAMDMMTLFSGKKLSDALSMVSGMVKNLKRLAEAMLDEKRTESVVKVFDEIEPLVKNLNSMSVEVIKLSKQATRQDNFGTVLENLSLTTSQLNQMIPEMQEKAPQMTKDLATIVTNLAVLTENFKLITPAITEIAPDLPKTSRRAVEALDEAVVLLKALQRNIFFRGNAQDVREEEHQRDLRMPASQRK